MEKESSNVNFFELEKLYFKTIQNLSQITNIFLYNPDSVDEFNKLDQEICLNLNKFKEDNLK